MLQPNPSLHRLVSSPCRLLRSAKAPVLLLHKTKTGNKSRFLCCIRLALSLMTSTKGWNEVSFFVLVSGICLFFFCSKCPLTLRLVHTWFGIHLLAFAELPLTALGYRGNLFCVIYFFHAVFHRGRKKKGKSAGGHLPIICFPGSWFLLASEDMLPTHWRVTMRPVRV